jgi:hypothetical protein
MSVNTYTFEDLNKNVYTVQGFSPPTEEDMDAIVLQQRQTSYNRVRTGEYKNVAGTSFAKNKKDNTYGGGVTASLEQDMAFVFDVPVDQVDAGSGVNGSGITGFLKNLWMKAGLDMRANFQEKYDAVANKYGKENIMVMEVDSKPRMILDTQNQDGQPKYMFLDSEGFSASDIGDATEEVYRTGATIGALAMVKGSVALDVATMGATKPLTLGAQVAGVSFIADMGAQTINDLVVGGYDRIVQDTVNTVKMPYGQFLAEQAKDNAIQSAIGVPIDLALPVAGRYISGFAGNGIDKYAQNLIASSERLNKEFLKDAQKIFIASGARTNKQGILVDQFSTQYSNTMRKNFENIRESLLYVQNAMKTGSSREIAQVVEDVQKKIIRDYQILTTKIADGDPVLQKALQKNLENKLKQNGIDTFFRADEGGNVLQGVLDKSFFGKKALKDTKYETTYKIADNEGLQYNMFGVYQQINKALNAVGSQPTKVQKQLLSSLNGALGTQYKSLQEIKNITKQKIKGKPNVINMKQLDSIIARYADEANYSSTIKGSDKTAQMILAEKISNNLRQFRNDAVYTFDRRGKPKYKKGFENTGKQLFEANTYYNKEYMPFFNLFGNKLIDKGAGYSAKYNPNSPDKFLMTGGQAIDNLITGKGMVDRYIKLLDPNDRSGALNILRKRYMQMSGADGTFKIGANNPIKYDTNTVGQLFIQRDAMGNLPTGKAYDKALREQVRRIDALNDIAKVDASVIKTFSEADVRQLMDASTPAQADAMIKKLRTIANDQTKVKKMEASSVINHVIKTGEFNIQPNMFADLLLNADKATIKSFKSWMAKANKDGNNEMIENIKTSVINELETMAKRGTGREQFASAELFDPQTMKNILAENTVTGYNAREILGKTTVRNQIDVANVLDYASEQAIRDAGGRAVMSSAGATFVFSDLIPMTQNKLYGLVSSNPFLGKYMSRNAGQDELKHRIGMMLPYALSASNGWKQLSMTANQDAKLQYYLEKEFEGIGLTIGEMQRKLDQQKMEMQMLNQRTSQP